MPALLWGGQYDAPKISGDATTTVVFNPLAKGAVVTPDANTAPSATGSAVDPSGSYSMDCIGVFNEVTEAENAGYSTTYCTQFESDSSEVFLHRISATTGSSTVYGVGAWMSEGANTTCGSTEGIDDLPAGMTLADSTQGEAFSWDANFSTFTKDSTTSEIADMIAAFGNAYGTAGSSTFNTYDNFRADPTGNCSWMDTNPDLTASQIKVMCTSMYYWQMIETNVRTAPAAYCVPRLNVGWAAGTTPSVTMSAKAGLGSFTTPMNRYEFMPLQFMEDSDGNQVGRMSSKEFWTFNAFDPVAESSVACLKTVGMLIEFQLPATDPVVGTQITSEFNVDSVVTSDDGVAASTTLCETAEASGGEMAPNGYFLRVTMTKQ